MIRKQFSSRKLAVPTLNPHPQPPPCPTPDAEKLSKAFCKITSMHNIRNIYPRIYVPDKAHPKIIKSSENIRNKT